MTGVFSISALIDGEGCALSISFRRAISKAGPRGWKLDFEGKIFVGFDRSTIQYDGNLRKQCWWRGDGLFARRLSTY